MGERIVPRPESRPIIGGAAMRQTLSGMSVAVLVTDGFEEEELMRPKLALEDAGALVHVVAPEAGQVKGWSIDHWGSEVAVDVALPQARATHYDALVLPGGVMSPDSLRTDPQVIDFTRSFFRAGKPVAAICHGPWVLVNAGVLRGRRVTSHPAIRADLENAGAEWVDEEVVVDHRLITSRSPQDLAAFERQIVRLLQTDATRSLAAARQDC